VFQEPALGWLTVSAADKVLERLRRVKQTRPDNYIAACPCCQSRQGRPLSIRSKDDGRVLIHAFCGCETENVLAALDLGLEDLFDQRLAHQLPPIRGGFSARELLELNAHEAGVVSVLACDAQTRPLTPQELSRLMQAAGRLQRSQDMACGR
jgi:hypothetical protein